MHHQACLFVHNQHILIFIKDIERDVLRQYFKFMWRLGKEHTDDIARLDPIVRFHGVSAYHDTSGLGGRLYLIARNTLQPHLQVLVNPKRRLTFVNNNTMVFVQVSLLLADFQIGCIR